LVTTTYTLIRAQYGFDFVAMHARVMDRLQDNQNNVNQQIDNLNETICFVPPIQDLTPFLCN